MATSCTFGEEMTCVDDAIQDKNGEETDVGHYKEIQERREILHHKYLEEHENSPAAGHGGHSLSRQNSGITSSGLNITSLILAMKRNHITNDDVSTTTGTASSISFLFFKKCLGEFCILLHCILLHCILLHCIIYFVLYILS